MPSKKQPPSIQQTAIGDGNVQIVGDKNVVNQTIIQKIFNIFRTDAETTEQRNRRIMLGHVENFWLKGILEKSLHGMALLELGIKEDLRAVNYPLALKEKENGEMIPPGTSMLLLFQEIGMGRSLLILGAPGSGKTTMLLELTRQLIGRAREDVTEPIPVVFNLSSWTENLTLADWLARELNNIYTIPKKTAPTWVKENKMLLLLDGLDEVKQERRLKCAHAINQFRKEYGLTNMVVSSRSQEYADLKAQLTLNGAIEIQPLTSNQVAEYFMRFGKRMAGIRQVLEKDAVLREMAETPLFLSIMTLAYQDTKSKDILVSKNLDLQRKYLFDTYIERMFRRPRSRNVAVTENEVVHWLSWLAHKMIEFNAVPYLLENMQPEWLEAKQGRLYQFMQAGMSSLALAVVFALAGGLIGIVFGKLYEGLIAGLIVGLFFGLLIWLVVWFETRWSPWLSNVGRWPNGILPIWVNNRLGNILHPILKDWNNSSAVFEIIFGIINGLIFGTIYAPSLGLTAGILAGLFAWTVTWLSFRFLVRLISASSIALRYRQGSSLVLEMIFGTVIGLLLTWTIWLGFGAFLGLTLGLSFGFTLGLLSWIGSLRGNPLHRGAAFELIFGMIFGPIVGMIAGLAVWLLFGLYFGVVTGLIAGIIGWMIASAAARLGDSWRYWLIIGLPGGLSFGLFMGLLTGLSGELLEGMISGLIFGLFSWLLIGFLGGLVLWRELRQEEKLQASQNTQPQKPGGMDIRMVESLKWSRKKAGLDPVLIGLVFSMALSLVGGLFFGLGIGLSIGLVVGLTAGLENRPVDQTTYPGQKIVFSIWNFFFVFTVIELIGGLIVLSILDLVGGLTTGLIVILVAVLIIGLSVGINFGGIPVFNHYSLRLLIYTSNHLPRHLVPFLDYCVDLIFLRRVGGGYIFVHRLLMEHFAAMYKEK